ncbi:MAG: hypothetical protein ACRYFS_02505 [Janthinobacterium lividum]
MLVDSLTDETLAALKDHLLRGIKATPLCLAVIGWLCATPTEPSIAEVRRNAEGLVWLRLSDETRMEPLCSFLDFLSQVRVICQSLDLTEMQTQQMIAWTRQRLG